MKLHAAVTGVGPVSAVGTGVEEFWSALLAGRSGTGPLTQCAPPRRGCSVAAEVADPPAHPIDPRDPVPRCVELARAAARLAWRDAAVVAPPERVGVAVGTGFGNMDLVEATVDLLRAGQRISPSTAFRVFNHASACELARELDIQGPIATMTSGCNSGMDAIGLALDWIRAGRADVVLVGGTEAELQPTFLGIMTAARALAVRHNGRPGEASRPFDETRDGNVPGEGAGFLVVESFEHARRRGAQVRAALAGFAALAVGTREPYDPFKPVFNTAPMVRTMRAALTDAGRTVGDVAAVSANGSSSVFYDPLEAMAIRELLGEAADHTPVHSVKGAIGQTGAATPALQAVAAVLSVERGLLPPTVNAEAQDPRCAIRLVRGEPLATPVRTLLANAIGFGGHYYASLVFTEVDGAAR